MPLNVVAKIAISAAITGLNMAVQSTRNLGDRNKIDDLAVTQGDYGAGIPRIWGTRRIEGAPIFWAEPLTEIKRRRKTKGGKYNDYSYFGSWACAVACHEISGNTRIWFDKHLVYDASGSGPITALTGNKGFVLSEHIRFYLGTETQEADPYMLASVEAAQGAGSCPAYRGIAYVMFEQIPLEKFGNRIPQVTIEAVTDSAASLVYEEVPTAVSNGYEYAINASTSWMAYFSGDGRIEWWDLPSRQNLGISEGFSLIGEPEMIGLAPDGTAYWMGFRVVGVDLVPNFYTCPPLGPATRGDDLDEIYGYGLITRAFDYDGARHVYSTREAVGYFSSGNYVTSGAGCARDFFQDQADHIWGIFQPDGSSDQFSLVNMITDEVSTFTALTTRADVSAARGCATAFGTFFVVMDGYYYAIDQSTMTISASGAWSRGTDYDILPYQFPGLSSWWRNLTEFSLQDGATIQTHPSGYGHGLAAFTATHDPLNQAQIMRPQFQSKLIWNYLGRISGNAVTLQTIAEDVAELCGITSHDFSAFGAITVDGWSVTSATGIDMLQPLLDIYDCDIRPHDFGVQGVVRGGASGGTIDYLDFVPGEGGRYAVKIAQAAEMPRAVILNFADKDHDQQVNSVRVSRPGAAVDTESEVSIDLTDWVATADVARQAAGRYFRRRWNSREVIAVNLTAQQVALEPADLRTLGLESDDRLGRLVRSTLTAGGVIAAEFVADDPGLHLLDGTAGPGFDGRVPETITVPGPVRGFVLDVPLAIDAHDNAVPFLYYAAGPYGASFAGAEFAVSDSGVEADFAEGWAAVDADGAASWGLSTAALGDALPWLFDNGNEINVKMQHGTPPIGVTADQLLADGALNLVLVGGEWIQYQSRTLESDGSYTLTGLLRGCRGTEHAIAGHSAGEPVLFVSAGLFRREMGAGKIADTDLYRAAAVGRDISGAYQTSVTFTAAANRPYAPVHGIALRNTGSGDWSISATRRTRIGGANVDGQDVPMGEVSESWAADIMDGATVKRTITGASLPLAYTSAQQTTDWGAPQTSIEVNLYQVSPALSLRGFPLNIAA